MDWLLLENGLWAGIATAGIAVTLNVPRRTLVGCFLAGSLGNMVRSLFHQAGMPLEGAALIGALAVGLLGQLFAHWWRQPTFVFTVPAAIPMLPGVLAFQTMMTVLQLVTVETGQEGIVLGSAGSYAVHTLLQLGAVALGILIPRLLLRHPKPIV